MMSDGLLMADGYELFRAGGYFGKLDFDGLYDFLGGSVFLLSVLGTFLGRGTFF